MNQNIFEQLQPVFDRIPDAVTHQNEEQLKRLNDYHWFFRLAPLPKPEATNAEQWFAEEFASTAEAFCRSLDTKPAFAMPEWQKLVNATIFPALVMHRLRYRRVLKLSLSDLSMTIGDNHKVSSISINHRVGFYCLNDDRLSEQGQIVDNEEQLDIALAKVIEKLGSEMEPYFRQQKIHPKLFWANILYACGLAFTKLSEQPIQTSNDAINTESLNQWLETLSRMVYAKGAKLNSVQGVKAKGFQQFFIRRETCCLKYKIGTKAKCDVCNLISLEHQQQQHHRDLSRRLD
ncbi:hypothetical protein BIZ37_18960 [Photobacterium sp. BZF1]|uniref:hypothetical protein n=1 Tax=Photobacterium sp. BZF1 TaxID=1904457 RepID=UPI0016535E57|nr:hypothetical protein [Photobacterium sp. BZF1]MBC7004646.1 hypothetical protein [Photobacterium sp. BZF1]